MVSILPAINAATLSPADAACCFTITVSLHLSEMMNQLQFVIDKKILIFMPTFYIQKHILKVHGVYVKHSKSRRQV